MGTVALMKTKPNPGLDLDRGPLPEMLGWLLRRTERVSMAYHRDLMDEAGLTPSQFEVLCLIRHNEGASQSAIARTVGVDRSTMVSLIDKLEGRGLIRRTPDPVDRRAHEMQITDEGRDFFDSLVPNILKRDKEFSREITAEECKVLCKLLSALSIDRDID